MSDALNGSCGRVEAPGDQVDVDAAVHAPYCFVAVCTAQAQPHPVFGDLRDGEFVDIGDVVIAAAVGGWLGGDKGGVPHGFAVTGGVVVGADPVVQLCSHGVLRSDGDLSALVSAGGAVDRVRVGAPPRRVRAGRSRVFGAGQITGAIAPWGLTSTGAGKVTRPA